jgi:hypothetical protein
MGIAQANSDPGKHLALKQSLTMVIAEFAGINVVVGIRVMAKRSVGNVHYRREPQEDDHSDLVNSVRTLQIQMNSLSAQILNAMEILVEQRQGQQQLHDECATIKSEVEEMCSKPNSISLVSTTTVILNEASSPSPQLNVPDLNSPPGPVDAEIDRKDPQT